MNKIDGAKEKINMKYFFTIKSKQTTLVWRPFFIEKFHDDKKSIL